MTQIEISKDYLQTLADIKQTVKQTRLKAAVSVNKELIGLYWNIGSIVLKKQKQKGWGTKITRKLSEDLIKEFPNMRGFSYTNVRYMQRFAENCCDLSICPQVAGKLEEVFLNIPWGHIRELLDKEKNHTKRLWYAQQTIENGWSRNVLVLHIESQLYERQAINEKKVNNFKLTLPDIQSDLAKQTIKDEYDLCFLDIDEKAKERQLENTLVDNIVQFILELGKGFAFIGRQYHLEVGGEDFYIDLLFYHLDLMSYVAIELKMDKFKPKYSDKMGFYLSRLDKTVKKETDNNSIGIILCKEINKEVYQDSIQLITKPIGVSTYKISKKLPEELKGIEGVKKFIKSQK